MPVTSTGTVTSTGASPEVVRRSFFGLVGARLLEPLGNAIRVATLLLEGAEMRIATCATPTARAWPRRD
jgi:hypothetical protein